MKKKKDKKIKKDSNEIIFEKGQIYRVKPYPIYRSEYITVCPSVTIRRKDLSKGFQYSYIYLNYFFKIEGYGKRASLVTENWYENNKNGKKVKKTYGGFVYLSTDFHDDFVMKKITFTDCTNIGILLRKKGYRYNTRTKELFKIKKD